VSETDEPIHLRFKGLLVRLRGIAKLSECLEASKGNVKEHKQNRECEIQYQMWEEKFKVLLTKLLTNTHNLQCDSLSSVYHGSLRQQRYHLKVVVFGVENNPSECKRGTEDAHEEVFACTKLLEFAQYHRCLSRRLP